MNSASAWIAEARYKTCHERDKQRERRFAREGEIESSRASVSWRGKDQVDFYVSQIRYIPRSEQAGAIGARVKRGCLIFSTTCGDNICTTYSQDVGGQSGQTIFATKLIAWLAQPSRHVPENKIFTRMPTIDLSWSICRTRRGASTATASIKTFIKFGGDIKQIWKDLIKSSPRTNAPYSSELVQLWKYSAYKISLKIKPREEALVSYTGYFGAFVIDTARAG